MPRGGRGKGEGGKRRAPSRAPTAPPPLAAAAMAAAAKKSFISSQGSVGRPRGRFKEREEGARGESKRAKKGLLVPSIKYKRMIEGSALCIVVVRKTSSFSIRKKEKRPRFFPHFSSYAFFPPSFLPSLQLFFVLVRQKERKKTKAKILSHISRRIFDLLLLLLMLVQIQ